MPAVTALIDPGTVSTLGIALAADADVVVGPNVATCAAAAEGDTEERGEGSRVSERLEQMERQREGGCTPKACCCWSRSRSRRQRQRERQREQQRGSEKGVVSETCMVARVR